MTTPVNGSMFFIPEILTWNNIMATRNTPTIKDGLISQRVPMATQKKMKRLTKKAKLPESVVLQIMVDEECKRVFNKAK